MQHKTQKHFYLFVLMAFTYQLSFAQLETSKWLFSGNYGTGIPLLFDFDTIPPTLEAMMRKMNIKLANSSICDKNGKILFYTNGIWIANGLHDTLLNGGRINPGTFPSNWLTDGLPEIQGTLILPFPSDSSKYYLFHNCPSQISPYPSKPNKMYYTLIDMTLDGGLGGVVSKNNVILNDTIHPGEITACKHANGRDWWMPIHEFQSNRFFWFLISPSGVSLDHTQNIGTIRDKSAGQICFSQDGKWLAQYSGDTEMNLYSFDRCSGYLSNYLHTQFPDSEIVGGVAFSPSSEILYATTPLTVYQFNLLDSDIISSQQAVAHWDSTYSPNPPFSACFHLMQLMRDNKIYIIPPNSTKTFHRINYPDSLGIACNVEQHFNSLPNFSAYTIPNFPNYYLGADSASVCDTLQLSVSILKSNKKSLSIKISPNPAKEILRINYAPITEISQLEIIDLNGKVWFNTKLIANSAQVELDVSQFIQGLYLAKISSKENHESASFMVVR